MPLSLKYYRDVYLKNDSNNFNEKPYAFFNLALITHVKVFNILILYKFKFNIA